MDIRIFELPPIGTNAMLFLAQERKEAVLFDAPQTAWASIESSLHEHGCSLVGLYFTHGHWDHMLGGAQVAAQGVRTYAHRDDERFFADPAGHSLFLPDGIDTAPVHIDQWVEHGEKLDILGQTVEVRHVPGHSPGGVIFHFAEEAVAVSGDALFVGSIGRTDLPFGDHDLLLRKIRQEILTLPESTVLLPGHGPRTTVAREKAENPFLQE